MAPRRLILISSALLLGACPTASPGAGDDADASGTSFLFDAHIITRNDSAVLYADGAPAALHPMGGFLVSKEYPDYMEALAAPPIRLETRIDDTLIDALDLRPGFCRLYCGECSDLGPLVYERVEMAILEDGTLQDWSEYFGCRRCKGELTERAICS